VLGSWLRIEDGRNEEVSSLLALAQAANWPRPHVCGVRDTRGRSTRGAVDWLAHCGTCLGAIQWPVGYADLSTDALVYHGGTEVVRRRDGRVTRGLRGLAAGACRCERGRRRPSA
jgi:hypothetical protein